MANRRMCNDISPADVAKYLLHRSIFDGELISPLKMQKLVYYAYAWVLVIHGKRLFGERFQAWARGPVVPSLYQELKRYGAAPIGADYIGDVRTEEDLTARFPSDIKKTLDEVYEEYMTKTAFELVVLTHAEQAWLKARKGFKAHERATTPLLDKDIIQQHSTH